VGAGLPQPYKELVTYSCISVLDSADEKLSDHFDAAFRFIGEGVEAGTETLVHCFAGKSRSTTTVIAWIMATGGGEQAPDAILSEIQKTRPIVQPNPGFMAQLNEFRSVVQRGQWRGGRWVNK
jgi:dual specificity phosphatase 12